MKGVMRFGKKGKLTPRYIGPYRIIRRVGQVAYELELPSLFQTEDMARDGMLQHSSIQASRSSGKLLFFTFNIYDLRSVRQIAAIYKDWPCVACIVCFLAACRLVLT